MRDTSGEVGARRGVPELGPAAGSRCRLRSRCRFRRLATHLTPKCGQTARPSPHLFARPLGQSVLVRPAAALRQHRRSWAQIRAACARDPAGAGPSVQAARLGAPRTAGDAVRRAAGDTLTRRTQALHLAAPVGQSVLGRPAPVSHNFAKPVRFVPLGRVQVFRLRVWAHRGLGEVASGERPATLAEAGRHGSPSRRRQRAYRTADSERGDRRRLHRLPR